MVDLVPLLIAAGAIVLWSLILYALQRRGLLEPRGLQPSPPPAGPFLMWKTVRGRQWIDRLARPARFWRFFGDLAIVLVGITMVGTTLLLLWRRLSCRVPRSEETRRRPNCCWASPGSIRSSRSATGSS